MSARVFFHPNTSACFWEDLGIKKRSIKFEKYQEAVYFYNRFKDVHNLTIVNDQIAPIKNNIMQMQVAALHEQECEYNTFLEEDNYEFRSS